MNFTKLLGCSFLCLLFTTASCQTSGSEENSAKTLSSGITYSDTLDNPREFLSAEWQHFYTDSITERYICLKNITPNKVKAQMKSFSELNGEGDVEYNYGITKEINGWVFIKIDSQHDAYSFHNLVYWFLGESNQDPLGSDESIGILVNGKKSYCIYNDYNLREQYGVLDVLFLASKSGNRELVSIPFDVVVADEENLIPSYSQILNKFGLTISEIARTQFDNFSCFYPE